MLQRKRFHDAKTLEHESGTFTAHFTTMSDDAVVQRDIDTMVERLHLRRWTPEERKEYVDAQSEHPIFMDAVPQVRGKNRGMCGFGSCTPIFLRCV